MKAKSFSLPPLSPLAGATFSVFFRVLRLRRVSPAKYTAIVFTFLLIGIGALFYWFDRLFFRLRMAGFRLQEPPVFILGHWRSGTTLLHNLLTQDPRSGFVTTYHAVFPNNLKSAWLFKTFMRVFMPRYRPGDRLELAVNLPQEDEYALSNLTHMSYYHFFYLPVIYQEFYRKYVRFESIRTEEKLRWKSIYQHMVFRASIESGGGRMVLKNPVNTGRIPVLLEIFPEARFIFLIRNPVEVYLSSVKFFTQLFPTLNLEEFTEGEIREMVLNTYVNLLEDYLNHRDLVPEGNLLELRYEHLMEQPLELVGLIYKTFYMPGIEEMGPVFAAYLKSKRDHVADVYQIGRSELDKLLIRLDFAMKMWDYTIPDNLEIVDELDESGRS